MGAAYYLAPNAKVTLFEAEHRLGGHARTVVAGRHRDQPVDTGFIVYNYVNYPNLLRLFEELPRHPIVTIARATELLETTKPTATKAVSTLVDAGILSETTGRRRDRTFGYARYLAGGGQQGRGDAPRHHLRVGTELEGFG